MDFLPRFLTRDCGGSAALREEEGEELATDCLLVALFTFKTAPGTGFVASGCSEDVNGNLASLILTFFWGAETDCEVTLSELWV